MMKNKPKKLTPKLRFPEFKDEWRPATIGDLFRSEDEYEKASAFESDKILTVKLHANGVVRNERTGTLMGGANYFKRRAGQFIFSKIDLLNGAFGIVPEELDGFYSSSDIPAFSFGTPHSPKFFLHWLVAHYRRLEIERTGTSATLRRVSPEKFRAVSIPLPSPAEQRKITACLMSLDEWIAAERRKLEVLRTHKKGLMQQLFPREGETRPRLRFPEFRNAPAWKVTVGGKLFTNRNEDGEEGLPIYSVTVNEGMVPRASFDRDFYDIEDPAGNKKVYKGDIAYNMMRMWQGAQGVAVEDCMVSPAYVVLAPLREVCSEFFAYLFKLPQSLHVLTSHSRGLTLDRLRLYFDDFKRVPFRVPEFSEQQRIATCLSSLDALIAVQSRKLDGLRAHKKGLMQQLFPSSEGV